MSLADNVQECAQDVNDELGPYLRENAYHKALEVALSDEGIQFTTEATIPVVYREFPVARMHPDLIVGFDERYIVELKVNSGAEKQVKRYLDHADRLGMDDIVGGIVISFGNSLEVEDYAI